jgi:hypothetical protein
MVMFRHFAAWGQLGNLNGEHFARNLGEILPANMRREFLGVGLAQSRRWQ